MCGIAGIFNINDKIHRGDAIRKMTDRIAHRGPDAEGIYVDEHVALGHRRLSIIDVAETANQPMWDHSGRYAIVFNGEIYNYQEIKKSLTDYPFKTSSDTEVILAAYACFGPACLDRFNGMFAFTVYDKVNRSLFMARDRVGKKPFYYALTSAYFLFSSEVRSILDSGLLARHLESDYLSEFLIYQAAMGPHTMVRGIKRLQAGCYALLQDGKFEEQRYWGFEGLEPYMADRNKPTEKIHDLFIDSVRLRMISDVPIGAFLSGGIDSSLVVACMAQLNDQPVNTFTISFGEKEFDESGYAKQVANLYNTRHHQILIKPEEFLHSLDDILNSMDTPSGDGPNTWLVAKYTRMEGIKVALSGLGGDELFAGYSKFIMYYKLMRRKWLLHFPTFLRHGLAETVLSLGPGHKSNKMATLIDLSQWDLSTVYPVLRRSYSRD